VITFIGDLSSVEFARETLVEAYGYLSKRFLHSVYSIIQCPYLALHDSVNDRHYHR
jgi:hypothetical protein